MRDIKKFSLLGLILAMAVPTYASNIVEIDVNKSQDVEVTADVSSSWIVTLPKTTVLTNPDGGSGDYTGSIPVTVEGDIGTHEVIKVDTDDILVLADETGANSANIDGAIAKGKIEFYFDDLTNGKVSETSHGISATLTPGEWKGIQEFRINLEKLVNIETDGETKAFEITGDAQTEVLDSISNSNHAVAPNKVLTTMMLKGPSNTTSNVTFNMPNNVNDGESVSIYTKDADSEVDSWEWASKETVENSQVTTEVPSNSTVVIAMSEAGLFNENNEKIKTWEELLASGAIVMTSTEITGSDPAQLNGYLVLDNGATAIGANAFANCTGLKLVTFSNGVTSIGDRAFSECTSLESVYFPKTVTSIGSYVYYKCSSIAYINVAAENPSYASLDGIMYTKDMTKLILCPNGKQNASVIVPEGVTTIGYSGFSLCTGVVDIQLPSTLQTIETKAFKNCTGLTSLTVPSSVTQIDVDAFYSVAQVYYEGNAAGTPWGAVKIN